MRDYQRKRDRKYILPRSVYHRVLWLLRDYDRLLEELAETDDNGLMEKCLNEIDVMDQALEKVPVEYQTGIWDNIIHGKAYPLMADRSTFGYWKSKLIYNVAIDSGYVPIGRY